jgi:hypothetical protein
MHVIQLHESGMNMKNFEMRWRCARKYEFAGSGENIFIEFYAKVFVNFEKLYFSLDKNFDFLKIFEI